MCKSVIHINNENCKLCKLNLIIPTYLNLYTTLSSTQSSMRLDMTDMNPRPEQLSLTPICLLSSEEQLRCDAGWAVWDLGKGGWRRVFHFTQLPWEIPAWEGVRLHYRRWGCHPFLSRASRCSSPPLILHLSFSRLPSFCSLSSAVHRLILWWQVFHRAVLGVQVRPHRGPRWALWLLAPYWPLLWAGKPGICPLQWEIPIHQVCGRWRAGGHWLLCPVQLHTR